MPLDGVALQKLFSNMNVDEQTDCWLWQGRLDRGGYGVFSLRGKPMRVHRLSAKLFLDADITRGRELCVLHKCDIRNCFNPDHLFLGTYQDNNRDCVRKGRHIPGSTINVVRGTKHSNSKLTEAEVKQIRMLGSLKIQTRSIGEEYGISSTMVSRILQGKAWAHVT